MKRSRPGPNAGLIVLIAGAAIVAAAWLFLLLIGAVQP